MATNTTNTSDVLDRAVSTGKSAGENLGAYKTADGKTSTVRPEFAGQTVQMGDRYVTYDDRGSPTSSLSVAHAQKLGNEYTKQNMGLDQTQISNAADIYRGIYNAQMQGGTAAQGNLGNAYGKQNIQYSGNYSADDYARMISEAAGRGSNVLAGYLEDSRNALLHSLGRDSEQTSNYNGGWNYVDNGGGVGNIYAGALADPDNPNQALGGGWYLGQGKGNAKQEYYYSNNDFPTMQEVIAYAAAKGYDTEDENAQIPYGSLAAEMVANGYVSPANRQKAQLLQGAVASAMGNLGIEGTNSGTGVFEDTIRNMMNAGGGSYQQVMQRTAAAQGAGSPVMSSAYSGSRSVSGSPAAVSADAGAGTQLGQYDPSDMRTILAQQKALAEAQSNNKIDFATMQAINELTRAEQDAQAQFQTQRNQIAADEMRGMDNAALYAEMRGDRGGIGQSQFNAVQATAAQNRLLVNQQQTKLATDTARQISDLRAQGEFEKADNLLTLTQNYLSQLMQLEQWATEYNLSVAQFNESIRQWQLSYEMSLQELNLSAAQWQAEFDFSQLQYKDKTLAASGEALLSMGVMPSTEQLAALGMTKSQASAYVAAAKAAATAEGKSGNGGGSTGDVNYDAMFADAASRGLSDTALENLFNQKSFYSKYGFNDSDGLFDLYEEWLDNQPKILTNQDMRKLLTDLNVMLRQGKQAAATNMIDDLYAAGSLTDDQIREIDYILNDTFGTSLNK